MDQSLGAYQQKFLMMNSIIGVNNLVENTKVTLLEQGLAIVSLDAPVMMNLTGIGVNVMSVVIGTTKHLQVEVMKLLLTSSQASLVNFDFFQT